MTKRVIYKLEIGGLLEEPVKRNNLPEGYYFYYHPKGGIGYCWKIIEDKNFKGFIKKVRTKFKYLIFFAEVSFSFRIEFLAKEIRNKMYGVNSCDKNLVKGYWYRTYISEYGSSYERFLEKWLIVKREETKKRILELEEKTENKLK